jgi:hypothetical protein
MHGVTVAIFGVPPESVGCCRTRKRETHTQDLILSTLTCTAQRDNATERLSHYNETIVGEKLINC